MQTREIPIRPLVVIGRVWQDTFQAFLRDSREYIREIDHSLLTLADDVESAVRQVTWLFPLQASDR